jgi:hypothetical protein
MTNLIVHNFSPTASKDLSKILRETADAVDAGKIVSLVMAHDMEGEYNLHWSASLVSSLVLASLLQSRAVERFKVT